jgi:hypothetical protein
VREWDGRDDVEPIVAVLRELDALSPATGPATTRPGDGRRLAAGVALILLLSGWAVVAIQVATYVASIVSVAYPVLVMQSFEGTVAPGPELRPLRITVTAAVGAHEKLRPKLTELLVIRSMKTMRNGPTAPLRFTSTAPPSADDVAAWLAPYGAEPDAAARAAAEALAVVAKAVAATTREALHAAAPANEALVEIMPMTPGWVAPVIMVAVFFLGAVPMTWALLRWAGRF